MKMIPFFTDDITIVPNTASADLAHLIGKPVSVAQFQEAVKAQSVALYELDSGELYVAAKRNPAHGHQPFFLEGPDARRARIAA